MQISVMDGGKDNFIPKEVNDLNELMSVIKTNTYSLGSFKDSYRSNNTFEKANFIGLDFDGGLSLEEAKSIFKNHTHIIGTTRNHQKEKNGVVTDRFRVILQLETSVTTASDLKATALSLLKRYPQADKSCSDAARMFFPCEQIVSYKADGTKETVLYHTKLDRQLLEKTKDLNLTKKGTLSKQTLEFIAFGAKEGEWNARLFKAAVDCNEQGYTEQEAMEALWPATAKFDGAFDDTDVRTISSAFNRDPKHPPRVNESCFTFKRKNELAKDGQEVEWLVEDYLIRGGISVLAGSPKSGKSTISRQLALSVLKGVPFLDREVKKGKVLYLALEESEDLLKRQLNTIGVTDDLDLILHVGPLGAGNKVDSLRQAINDLQVDLVVIDTLLLMVHFQNINDYNEVYQKMSDLRNVARETRCHILCLHHQNKGENRGSNSILGSSAIQGAVDGSTVFNNIPGRHAFRKLNSDQRGGKRFIDKELKYIPELDMYEVSATLDEGW